MGKRQQTLMKFNPSDGSEWIVGMTADAYRAQYPHTVWRHDPWTGALRRFDDTIVDRKGLLIIPPGEPMYANAERNQTCSALNAQVAGTHYKKLKIQPIEYIHANSIGFAEGNVIKYVTRWRDKGGVKDLEKARHFLDLLIELESLK